MIAVELSFTPDPQRLAARPAHRSTLERIRAEGSLIGAGPWADDSGALLIFDATPAEVDEIMRTDAYYSTSGVSVVAIREWTPIDGLEPRT